MSQYFSHPCQLTQKGIKFRPIFPLCHSKLEFTSYLFTQCFVTKNTWELAHQHKWIMLNISHVRIMGIFDLLTFTRVWPRQCLAFFWISFSFYFFEQLLWFYLGSFNFIVICFFFFPFFAYSSHEALNALNFGLKGLFTPSFVTKSTTSYPCMRCLCDSSLSDSVKCSHPWMVCSFGSNLDDSIECSHPWTAYLHGSSLGDFLEYSHPWIAYPYGSSLNDFLEYSHPWMTWPHGSTLGDSI